MIKKAFWRQLFLWSLVVLLSFSTTFASLPLKTFAETTEKDNVEEDISHDSQIIASEDTPQEIQDTNIEENNIQDSNETNLIIGEFYTIKFIEPYIYNHLTISKDIEIIAVASSENTLESTIGSEKISFDSSLVEIVGSTVKPDNNVIDIATTEENFTVYADVQKTASFVTGKKAMSLNVLGYENNMYIVEIGSVKGYLSLDDSLSYASVINTTNLYSEDKKTILAKLEASDNVYIVKRSEDPAYYMIEWQGNLSYIKTTDLAFKTTNSPGEVKPKILTLTVPNGTAIYKDASSSTKLGEILASQEVAIVSLYNGYYEIQFGGNSAYIKVANSYSATIKKHGNLQSTSSKVVGKIYSGSSKYSVTPTSTINMFQIAIGSNNFLIDASLLSLSDSNITTQETLRKDIVQLKANTKIYSDENFKNLSMTITSSTRTSILDISNNTYKVQVGNTVGYIPISSTTGNFTVKLKLNANLYSDTKKSKIVAKNSNSSMVYTISRTTNNSLFLIKLGTKNYYVDYSDLTFTYDSIASLKNNRNDTITTKSGFVLYKTASTKTPLLESGAAGEKFTIAGTYGQYYIIELGQTIAYLPEKYATGVANKEISLSAGTVLYKYINKKYVAVGTVNYGFSFKSTSVNSNYYLFNKDNETFAIKKSAAIPTNKSVTLKSKHATSLPITLYSEKNTAVYDAAGKQIGTMYKGQSVALKAISGSNKAIIDFMGQQAQVTFKDFYHKDIVNGKSTISYSKMAYYIRVFNLLYPEFTKQEVIGYSSEGRAIYALRVGNGKNEVLMDASFHAREYMTTNVLLEMIDSYSYSYNHNTKYYGWNVKSTLNNVSIWFLPMMNPDGVSLVQQGISALKNKSNISNAKKYAKNGSFNSWKANGRGVDLNSNFGGVSWEKIPSKKGYMGYKGPTAFSETESKAFIEFVNKHKFKTNISYHSSGNIIFYGGVQTFQELSRDAKLVNKIAGLTRYSPIKPKGSAYNYKYGSGNSTSWVIKEKRIPAITVEIAPYQGEKPVSLNQWSSIWDKNKTIGLVAASEAALR